MMHKFKPIKEFIGASIIHFFVRLVLAALTSHFIVIYRETDSIADLLYEGHYWPAFFGSFFIAWLLIEWVFQVTYFLEANFPWQNSLWRRFYKQLFAGFFGGCVVAMLGASVYFAVRQINILDTDYFQYDLLPVAIFCFALNVLYCFLICLGTMYKLWLQMYSSVNSQKPLFLMNWSMQDEYLAFKKVEERLRVKSNGLPASDCRRSDDNKEVIDILTAERIAKISCIGILSKVVFVFYKDASKASISMTLNKLIKILPKDDFFMINQSCIMRRSLILGTEPLPSRRVQLVLKHPFDKLDYEIIKVVSQRASSGFLVWYNNHKG